MLRVMILVILSSTIFAQNENLIPALYSRPKLSLNGNWRIIIDPYENGYYNYRYEPHENGYFKNQKPNDKSDLIEYDFDKSEILRVPGDWNTQMEKLFVYEGTVWYKRSFTYSPKQNKRTFIYFGAVNYEAKVYLNGKKLGEHTGGFTPFSFEITDIIKPGDNFVIVKVSNVRKREGVPTLNTDWWNYGGITRDVYISELPENYISDYYLQLKKGTLNEVTGWVQLNYNAPDAKITIPELNLSVNGKADQNGKAAFSIKGKFELWNPANPKLYDVIISTSSDTLRDKIGFRSIETKGDQIVLNGKPVFLKGISIHEEAPLRTGRAFSNEDAVTLLSWAKELGCNFVRLAHYPHNEHIIRQADKMGMMVWSEIPVYWTILWDNPETYRNASGQLTEMVKRDMNRASIIIWSVANETPRGDSRLKFLSGLINQVRMLDPSRLITAATELHYNKDEMIIDDPLSENLDVIGVNEYIGWYSGKPSDALKKVWINKFNKPLIISEFGADALYNHHGDKDERWTEEYQADVYYNQIEMLKKIPFLRGVSPWILTDFRSPRRHLPGIQDFFNRKGLISDRGEKKQAFFILQNFYKTYQNP